jgi:hypothetical protein
MFKFLSKKRAQSSLEYAILIIIVLGALLSIQVYIKRGLQGRLRSATDDIGEQYKVGGMNITKTTKFHSKSNEVALQGVSTSTLTESEYTNVLLNQAIAGNTQQDYWGK